MSGKTHKIFIFILIVLFPAACLLGQNDAWEFNSGKDDFDGTALLDLRYLNEQYAGSRGFITLSPDKESFAAEAGGEIRFWAVNGASAANKMTDGELAYFARFLAGKGVNMIRYHGSLHPRQAGVSLNEPDMNEIASIQRVVEAMKKEGIYTTISMYYTHMVEKVLSEWAIPGYPDGDKKLSAVMFFHKPLQEAYKNWVKVLLEAPNPFSGVPLKNEPAVALLQVQNEDGLFFYTVSNVSNNFRPVMHKAFGKWLLKRYGSLAAASSAWGGAPVDGDMPGDTSMSLYNIYDATLALNGPKSSRMDDQIEFFEEVQRDFYSDVIAFIRQSGCRQLINCSNWKTASAARLLDAERMSVDTADVMAVNRYYSPGHTGTNSAWRIDPGHFYEGRSVLLQPEKFPVNIKQSLKHPFIISESGWNLPHKYQSEGPFLVSAYMSLTGIDAFYWFNTSSPGYDENPYFHWTNLEGGQHPLNRWTISTPGQVAMFPANALAFRNKYIKESQIAVLESRTRPSVVSRIVPAITEELSFDPARDTYEPAPEQTRLSPLTYLAGKVTVEYNAARDSVVEDSRLPGKIDYSKKSITSLTGELKWDYKQGTCVVNAPCLQGICGFPEPGKIYRFDNSLIATTNDYLAAVIVSLDGLPLDASSRILIQTGTVYRPSGWSEQPETFDNKGTAVKGFKIISTGTMPWQCQNTRVTVALKNKQITRVSLLNENGYRLRNIPFMRNRDSITVILPSESMYVILDNEVVGVDDRNSKTDLISLYPNPSGGHVTIDISSDSPGVYSLDVFDLSGNKLLSFAKNTSGRFIIGHGALKQGCYLASVRKNDTGMGVQRFIIM